MSLFRTLLDQEGTSPVTKQLELSTTNAYSTPSGAKTLACWMQEDACFMQFKQSFIRDLGDSGAHLVWTSRSNASKYTYCQRKFGLVDGFSFVMICST